MNETSQDFWSGVARRYAAMPTRNREAYELTLGMVKAHLRHEYSVLEVGCGTASTALRLAPDVERYVASDFAPEMIVIAREKAAAKGSTNLELIKGSFGDGSLPEGDFNVILAFNLLHLLPDRNEAYRDILDRLPRGGLFISKTPCLGGMFRVLQPLVAVLRRFGKAPDVRFVKTGQLEREIRLAGFEILQSADYPRRPPSRFIVAKKL